MKILIGFVLLLFSLNGISQSSATHYFDEDMHPVAKKKAVIYGTGAMDSGLYKLSGYYLKKKNQLAYVGYFTDSTRRIREGSHQFYYEDGSTSKKGIYRNGKKEGLWISYYTKGDISEEVTYKDNIAIIRKGFFDLKDNRQRLVTIDDVLNNTFHSTLYDNQGQVISKETIPQDYKGMYINVDTVSTFPGSLDSWLRYITKAISSQLGDLFDGEYGTLIIRFVVDTKGNIIGVKPLSMLNSGFAQIAMNALKKGPKWIPAEYEGKKVNTVMYQPFTLRNPTR